MSYPKLKSALIALSLTTLSLNSIGAYALSELSDDQLGEKSGQALLNLSTLMPGEFNNPNSNVGFYKVGIQSQLDLNANIRKLQLGCGGVNGSGGCDIDIDYFRLTGLEALNPNGSPNNSAAPNSDFSLTNPFIEFAMQDPDSLVNRKVVGLRIGADAAKGVLAIGTRPVDASNNAVDIRTNPAEDISPSRADVHTGINQISGVYDHLIVRGNATVAVPLGGTQQGALDENFQDVFSSRADVLRLKPINVKGLQAAGFVNVRPTDADFINDNRFFHNIRIANGNEAASGFYISLSSLGNSDVWVKTNGSRTASRQAGINDNVVNKPNPDNTPVAYNYATTVAGGEVDDNDNRDPQYRLTTNGQDNNVNAPQNIVDRDGNAANNWLAWYTTDGLTGAPEWEAANRGWSIRLPVVEVSNFATSPVQGEIATLFSGYAPIDNSDLGQVPPTNCFGALNFC